MMHTELNFPPVVGRLRAMTDIKVHYLPAREPLDPNAPGGCRYIESPPDEDEVWVTPVAAVTGAPLVNYRVLVAS